MTPVPLFKSERNTKILITLFLLTIAAAMAVAELNVYDKVGRVHSGVMLRYGPEITEFQSGPDVLQQPTSVLTETEPIAVHMNTFTSLVDITHPHIFQIPLILFVLAHFLMRTRTPNWFKLTNYLGAFGGAILFMAAPWTVRYISVNTDWLLYVGSIAIGVTTFVMILVPIWDMWRPTKKHVKHLHAKR